MTQATQSTPQGKFGGDEKKQVEFLSAERCEDAATGLKAWADFAHHTPLWFIRLGCLVFRKC